MSSATASASASAAAGGTVQPASYKVIGVLLAVGSGLLIGGSFIFKKKGLIAAQRKSGGVKGEGHEYLKSWLWWTGMIVMVIGELMNLIAYSFTDAILVTPMGSLAVVTSGILAHFILKERLTTFGWLGSTLSILGSVIIALNGPAEETSTTIQAFQKKFLSVGFLVWGSLCLVAAAGMVFFVAPKYGKKNMLVYIVICSLLGGLSVACTSGLGGAILTSIRGDASQWKHWFMYFLLAFVVTTLLLEINYLNKALELYNSASVTAAYYVIFTSCTLITSIILNQGFHGASTTSIITLVLGFLVIVVGVALLQLSKVEPEDVKSGMLDGKTSLLLSAARSETTHHAEDDPGIDAIRGISGVAGTIHRAISMRSRGSRRSSGRMASDPFHPEEMGMRQRGGRNGAPGAMWSGPAEQVRRYDLRDEPISRFTEEPQPMSTTPTSETILPTRSSDNLRSGSADGRSRANSAIQFSETDQVHRYTAKWKKKGGDSQHLELRRPAGAHEHQPSPPPSGDIASIGVAGAAGGDFSAARSGSLFASNAYRDPYAEDVTEDGALTPTTRSRGASIADRLGSVFSSSPKTAHPPFDFEPHSLRSPPLSATKHRFTTLSPFRTGGSGDSGGGQRGSSRERQVGEHDHRVPHPRGPRDMQARDEEAALVARDDDFDEKSDDEHVNMGGRLEQYDSRDEL
ncbi:hypothetical protein JCM10908_002040 [Rhodotorula pacifica]|uniref:uncharacterized protein n=1 Tax=Rhodotorula pacifica TaxID=1495444 RepID=UPI003172D178